MLANAFHLGFSALLAFDKLRDFIGNSYPEVNYKFGFQNMKRGGEQIADLRICL